jgi:hypothetical protein
MRGFFPFGGAQGQNDRRKAEADSSPFDKLRVRNDNKGRCGTTNNGGDEIRRGLERVLKNPSAAAKK